jgi:predicted nuclease of predicted toxin-antitoxin system
VKLLLDHNISHKLCARLSDLYPESSHTRFLHFERAADPEIWFHARTHGFIIVTKDKDIGEFAMLKGAPPKIVWLRIGNCSTGAVEAVLRASFEKIAALAEDNEHIVLELFE